MLSDYLSVYEQTAHNFQVEHNETHIFLNEFNQNLNNVNNQTEFEGISFEDIDLTELIEIDSLSNNNQQVNAFDLSDTKLFDFISEIELITAECVDLNSPINSPLSEISHSNLIENFSSNESVCDSVYDSFSSACSPGSESDQSISNDKIKMVKSNRRIDKKESNKAAASRYRSKKLKEKDQLFTECELYEKKNETMKQKISDIEAEINSVRSLLLQAFLMKDQVLNNSILKL